MHMRASALVFISLSVMYIQWNPSKADTIGTKDFLLYRDCLLYTSDAADE